MSHLEERMETDLNYIRDWLWRLGEEVEHALRNAKKVLMLRDSAFIFGATGTGDASLTVNGVAVPVAPNGAWLAWLAVPGDSILTFTIVARTATDSATLVYPVRRVARFHPPSAGTWIDSTSISPGGRAWWPADEFLPVSVRAAEGADVRLRFADGTIVPLAAQVTPDEVPWAGTRRSSRGR